MNRWRLNDDNECVFMMKVIIFHFQLCYILTVQIFYLIYNWLNHLFLLLNIFKEII